MRFWDIALRKAENNLIVKEKDNEDVATQIIQDRLPQCAMGGVAVLLRSGGSASGCRTSREKMAGQGWNFSCKHIHVTYRYPKNYSSIFTAIGMRIPSKENFSRAALVCFHMLLMRPKTLVTKQAYPRTCCTYLITMDMERGISSDKRAKIIIRDL